MADELSFDPETEGAVRSSEAIAPAMRDWYMRGGLAGSLGMTPADQQISDSSPLAPGGLAKNVLSPGWMDNPMLWAVGPGVFGGKSAANAPGPWSGKWFTGADTLSRHTISDEGAKLNPEVMKPLRDGADPDPYLHVNRINDVPERDDVNSRVKSALGRYPRLDEVLDHPDLFENYPQLKDITVRPLGFGDVVAGVKGYYHNESNTIGLATGKESDLISTLLHEVQHKIQSIEGFARGGNPDEFLPKGFRELHADTNSEWNDVQNQIRESGANASEIKWGFLNLHEGKDPGPYFEKELAKVPADVQERAAEVAKRLIPLEIQNKNAFDQYHRLAGEVESRTVQEQFDQQDWNRLPHEYEGYIPKEDQIVRFGTPDTHLPESTQYRVKTGMKNFYAK